MADVVESDLANSLAVVDSDQPAVAGALLEASESYDVEDPSTCLAELRKCADRYSDLPSAELMLAVLHCNHQNLAQARTQLNQIAASESSKPEFLLTLARLNRMESRFVEATVLVQRAIELATERESKGSWPTDRRDRFVASCKMERVAVLERQGKWKLVAELFAELAKEVEWSDQMRERNAKALFLSGDLDTAKTMLEEISEIETEQLLAKWHIENGDHEAAEKRLRDRATSEETIEAKVALAEFLLDRGKSAAAKEFLGTLDVGNERRVSRIDALKARLAIIETDWQKVIEIMEPAYHDDPSDLHAANVLARALIASDRVSQVARGVDIAIAKASQYPNDLDAIATLGWAQLHSGRISEAERTLMGIATQYEISADVAYFTSRALAANGKGELANELLVSAFASTAPFDMRKHAKAWHEKRKEIPNEDQPIETPDVDIVSASPKQVADSDVALPKSIESMRSDSKEGLDLPDIEKMFSNETSVTDSISLE